MPTFIITDPFVDDTIAVTHSSKSRADFRKDFEQCMHNATENLKASAKSYQVITIESVRAEAIRILLKMRGYRKMEVSATVDFIEDGPNHLALEWCYQDKETKESLCDQDLQSADGFNKWNEKARREQSNIKKNFLI